MGGNGFGTRTFWTVAIPDSDVTVNFAAGRAEMHVDNLTLADYTKIPISLGPNWQTAFVPATVSFDVVWNGPVTRRVNIQNNVENFSGEFAENQATVTWSASEAGFSFTSNPGNFSTSEPGDAFAELGHDANGMFFNSQASANLQTGIVAPATGVNAPIAGTTNATASTTQSLWNSLNYPLATNNSQNGLHDSLPPLTATLARPVSESVFEFPSDSAAPIW